MDPADTRENLILAAERLFAEKGIDNVSLREINRAAGQKNVAALHYHFGTREMLLEAIFERRMAGINRRRVAMLDAMEAIGPITQVRPVVTAMVAPLAEQLDPTVRGQHYVRFLAQVISDPGVDLGGLVRDKFDHGRGQVRKQAAQQVAGARHAVVELVAHQTAQIDPRIARRDAGGRTTGRSGGTQLFVANLIDSIAGALTAPVSDETMALLTEVPRKTA